MIDIIDMISSVAYVALAILAIYFVYQLLRTEAQVRKNDAKNAPYKVDAPVATAPLGRKRAPAKKAAVVKTTKRPVKKTTKK